MALRRGAVLIAVLVLVAGTGWAWLGLVPFSREPYQICGPSSYEEMTSTRIEFSLRPPGSLSCTVTDAAGTTAPRTFFPARDYLSVLLMALAAGAALQFGSRGGRRWAGLGLASSLGFASFLVFFGLI